MRGEGYDIPDWVIGFEFVLKLVLLTSIAAVVALAFAPPTGNDKIYIYDVDFYETMTITEKEID